MRRLKELEDDYAHINPWGRQLLRDMAKDFRKLFPNSQAPASPGLLPALSAPKQLINQRVEGSPAVGAADAVCDE